jgi:O-antigen/teichoic acid export membrane protein
MQISRQRTASWNIFFHMASIAVTSLGALVTIRTYIDCIPLAIYGAWLATGNILAWATMVDPGLGIVIQQKVAAALGARKIDRIGELAMTGVSFGAAISVLILLVCSALIFLLPWILGKALPPGQVIENACWIAALGSALTVASFPVTSVLLGLQVSVSIGIVYLLTSVSSLILQIVLVRMGWGPAGIAMGSLIRGGGGLLFSTILMVIHLRRLAAPIRFTAAAAKEVGTSVSYTFASRLLSVVASNLDSLIVARFVGAEFAPALRSTRASADIVTGIVNRPIVAISPVISHIAGSDELASKSATLGRIIVVSLWLATIAAGGVFCLNHDFVSLWVGDAQFAGYGVNLAFSLAILANTGASVMMNILVAIGYIRQTSIITAVQALGGIAVSLALGATLGLIGIPAAAMISGALATIAYSILIKRSKKLPIEILHIMRREILYALLATSVTAWLFSMLIPHAGSWAKFSAHAFIYLIMVGSCLFLISKESRVTLYLAIDRLKAVVSKIRRIQTT